MITATTRLVALLGHPVDHSLSPRMQNAAFAAPELDEATILVNATPLRDELPVAPRAGGQVVDLAYRPDGRPTALVEAARAAGCSVVVDGLEILVRQGAASFELWTGVAAPADVMRAAVTRIV